MVIGNLIIMTLSIKTARNLILSLIALISAGYIGFLIGDKNAIKSSKSTPPSVLSTGKVVNSNVPEDKSEVDFSLFWDVWGRLESKYIDKSKLDPKTMVYGAISGMVQSLEDPYTIFLPPQQQKEAKQELGGTFEGIGAELGMKDNRIVVITPLDNMPASKAGIKTNDWIVKVNGEETLNWTVIEAVNKIRGEKGTTVLLTVLHEGEQQTNEISVVRGTILVKSVEVTKTYWRKDGDRYTLDNNCTTCPALAHLRLSRFGDQTNKEWIAAISQIKNQFNKGEIKAVVFDVRNNPGGYLTGAVYVAAEFLQKGLTVVQQENSDGTKDVFTVEREGSLLKEPLVVLINKGSASASEIVAGALRDHARAKLVGEKTFGKGSIQEAQDLDDGSGLHITVAHWLLPKGDWINQKGVEPEKEVVLDTNKPNLDTQLEEAANMLLSG